MFRNRLTNSPNGSAGERRFVGNVAISDGTDRDNINPVRRRGSDTRVTPMEACDGWQASIVSFDHETQTKVGATVRAGKFQGPKPYRVGTYRQFPEM